MLSDKQKQLVVWQVNQDLDVPFVGESQEGEWIGKLVDRINPSIAPALESILPMVYLECIRIALNEEMTSDQRRAEISQRLVAELNAPLAKQLNDRVDVSFIPESFEGTALEKVSEKIIQKFVKWTVGELQQKLDSEYEEAGMAAPQATA
eukprot:TRINITY_DN1505_c0_g1_i1.p3 TRINITY_DN1505_c0_g1~~TRINITY_DN1505_c0_g1_i1.p3  ORF type:complete len:150 (+),score=25.98 TRINITY_DN1505_c0_g1_i1:216-665(+)